LQHFRLILAAGGNLVDALFTIGVLDFAERAINFKMSHNILLNNIKMGVYHGGSA
jgi:hypothetical protein